MVNFLLAKSLQKNETLTTFRFAKFDLRKTNEIGWNTANIIANNVLTDIILSLK
jgi:hypothetical protein